MAVKSDRRQAFIRIAWAMRKDLRRNQSRYSYGECRYDLGYYHGLLTGLRSMRRGGK